MLNNRSSSVREPTRAAHKQQRLAPSDVDCLARLRQLCLAGTTEFPLTGQFGTHRPRRAQQRAPVLT